VLKSINLRLESRSAHDCFRVATTSLELARRAKEQKEQWEIEHHSITGITFVAFSIEAMINHFGKIYFPDWDNLKECRKSSHKKLFKSVNLPNYLGAKEYQVAKRCFDLRDMLAHGKTLNENLTIELPKDTDSQSIFQRMLSVDSKPFREVSYELLKLFVDTSRKIEKDIEQSGFYPNQEHISQELRKKLCECPLSVSGVRTW